MLEKLRKMPLSAKKKLVAFCAGSITVSIFGGWFLHSKDIFSKAYQSASTQGVALFSFVEQNVQIAHDAFQANMPNMTATSSEEIATSTDMIEASTTAETSTSTATTTITN